ncbi:putative signaling protein [Sphingobium sp. SYK-6]|uniref:putative bifunctional diguanylate cyclase/phosphodiesterase n=1 Tax=Sphingobium sp. (strain NBRC 103272 / SYK-6) TaxID=627192 RepID=UPI00022771BA|nr:EAL domain-containing protein [Sphingobium sp. SYK-6]BAK66925.1 putative signaling protein [Sphingobium sp. SYK-6]
MTNRVSPRTSRPDGLPETLSLGVLMGFTRLPGGHVEFVHGQQLRAADRMLGLYTALAAISVFLINVRFQGYVPIWVLALWTLFLVGVHIPSFRMRQKHVASDYSSVTRAALLRHGLWSFLQGCAWAAAILAMGRETGPAGMVTLWTIACCLMAATAMTCQSTPLSAAGLILPISAGAIWMMGEHADPMLAAVGATYAILLLAASLRQAHLFGVQLTTSKMLAEKREVVSLLLKEHDVEAADALWQIDAARRLTGVSPSFARMLGTTCEALEGRSILQVLAGPAWETGAFDPALHELAERLKQRAPFSDLVLPVVVNEEQRWWQISASPRTDDKGVFHGFRGVGSDITVQKEAAERIAQMARFDMLTGLPNRLHLTEELSLTITQVSQWHTRCGFIMIDLDRFKSVNDTLGHLIGDQLLAQVAERLRKVCSPNELCGRLGGDEFAVLVRDVGEQLYIDRLAAEIIKAVSQPYLVNGHTLFVGASVGSALAPNDGRDAETLMRNADLAMYRAKEAGRGKHQHYTPSMHADAEERRTLEIALRDALARDELYLLFQPIVSASDGRVSGFEALARWLHPELGQVSPSRFIPVAEDARLMGPIGNWVLRSACREAATWPEDVRVSVNVSPEQLYDPAFLETVVAALAHSGLPANRLELEVTESVFLREGMGAGQLLEKLMKLGVCLALDDFGTGYSSLGYLSRTRFSTIKIDRSFVEGAARNQRESLAIVRAVVAMAQGLDMETTAEGVETEGEFDLLRALGCTNVQGYYFGRPMPAADARALFGSADSQVA